VSPAGKLPGMPEAELDAALLQLVRVQPGRARTHYERLEVRSGGIKTSQERKERSMDRLLAAGLVLKTELPRAVGRQTHGIWPAAENSV
jgi:hypothetical protein